MSRHVLFIDTVAVGAVNNWRWINRQKIRIFFPQGASAQARTGLYRVPLAGRDEAGGPSSPVRVTIPGTVIAAFHAAT
jgi:hypothetical protein